MRMMTTMVIGVATALVLGGTILTGIASAPPLARPTLLKPVDSSHRAPLIMAPDHCVTEQCVERSAELACGHLHYEIRYGTQGGTSLAEPRERVLIDCESTRLSH